LHAEKQGFNLNFQPRPVLHILKNRSWQWPVCIQFACQLAGKALAQGKQRQPLQLSTGHLLQKTGSFLQLVRICTLGRQMSNQMSNSESEKME